MNRSVNHSVTEQNRAGQARPSEVGGGGGGEKKKIQPPPRGGGVGGGAGGGGTQNKFSYLLADSVKVAAGVILHNCKPPTGAL